MFLDQFIQCSLLGTNPGNYLSWDESNYRTDKPEAYIRSVMGFPRFTSALIVVLSIVATCCAQESLGDAARRVRSEKQTTRDIQKATKVAKSSTAKPAVVGPGDEVVSAMELATPEQYAQGVRDLLTKGDFAKLDVVAQYARANKTRFVGGGWKLFTFYGAICPDCARGTAQQNEALIERLKKWVGQNPNSVTARIALANAYHDYAWQARGDKSSDQVDVEAWKPFRERIALAQRTLEEASQLDEKCPQWYASMERVGRSAGWDLARLHELVNSAKAMEPTYFYVYQEYAYALQPKWMGQEGDSERFADQIASLIGDRDGAEVYFKIAADMYCGHCNGSPKTFALMSWKRIQDGYSVIKQRYGVSDFVMNEMALMAVDANDSASALNLFMQIGDRWDKDIWGTEANYQLARSKAMEPPEYIKSAWADSGRKQSEKDKQYQARVLAQFQKLSASAMQRCEASVKDDSQKFFVAMRLGQNGATISSRAWPPTRFSECLLPKIPKYYLAPPSDGYWVFFPVNYKPGETGVKN